MRRVQTIRQRKHVESDSIGSDLRLISVMLNLLIMLFIHSVINAVQQYYRL